MPPVTRRVGTVAALVGTVVVGTAGSGRALAAQSGALTVGATGAAVQPSSRIGSGSLSGVGPTVGLPLGSWTALEAAAVFFPRTTTERGDVRRYSAVLPSLTFRATMVDGRSQLVGLISGAAMHTRLEAAGGAPAETRLVPMLGVGLGLRARLFRFLAADLTVRDWLSWVRTQEFSATPGKRGLGQSLDVRAGLHAVFGRRAVTTGQVGSTPLAFAPDYRPVPAGAVRTNPTRTDGGRTHLHSEDGEEVALAVVPDPIAAGQEAPGDAAMLLVARGLASPSDDRLMGDLYFETGYATVAPQYRLMLENIAEFLRAQPHAFVELRGFTDRRGSSDLNNSLAERRVTAVKELLVRVYGIDGLRIATTAVGIDFTSPQDLAARRVEVRARVPRAANVRSSAR